MRVCLAAKLAVSRDDAMQLEGKRAAYHGPNVWMGNCIKLLKVKLVVWADIDIGSPILRHVAVFWSREY